MCIRYLSCFVFFVFFHHISQLAIYLIVTHCCETCHFLKAPGICGLPLCPLSMAIGGFGTGEGWLGVNSFRPGVQLIQHLQKSSWS